MTPRKLGMELELFLIKNGEPLLPQDWCVIMDRAKQAGHELVFEPYTGFPLGFKCADGMLVLDNNASVLEIVCDPLLSIDAVMARAKGLLDLFMGFAPGVRVKWCSQHGCPDEKSYQWRTVSRGLYRLVRDRGWDHWQLSNSMAFQPAIDVSPTEAADVLRVLYLSAPFFIHYFENRHFSTGTGRNARWFHMVPSAEKCRLGLPRHEIRDLSDYWRNLMELPVFLRADGIKAGTLTGFMPDQLISVKEALHREVPAIRLDALSGDVHNGSEQARYTPVFSQVQKYNLYEISLPFWFVRIVFDPTETGENWFDPKGRFFLELRHLGTPDNWDQVSWLYHGFLNMVERAEKLNVALSRVTSWQRALGDTEQVITDGRAGENFAQIKKILNEFEIFEGGLP